MLRDYLRQETDVQRTSINIGIIKININNNDNKNNNSRL